MFGFCVSSSRFWFVNSFVMLPLILFQISDLTWENLIISLSIQPISFETSFVFSSTILVCYQQFKLTWWTHYFLVRLGPDQALTLLRCEFFSKENPLHKLNQAWISISGLQWPEMGYLIKLAFAISLLLVRSLSYQT